MSMWTEYNHKVSWHDVMLYIEAIYAFGLINTKELYVADEEWWTIWSLSKIHVNNRKNHWFWSRFD